jgi:hypothetical protein
MKKSFIILVYSAIKEKLIDKLFLIKNKKAFSKKSYEEFLERENNIVEDLSK